MPKRNVATNYTFEQQRQEINLIAADLWDGVLGATTSFSTVSGWGDHSQEGYLKADGTVATTAAFTFGNKIIGPSTFTIEPTNVNGTVVIAGNLQVDGTQTAVNSTTMDVTDLNITVAKGAANAAAADTAGITVDGASATLQYEDGSPGTWESSLGFRLDGKNGSAGLALDLAGSADYLIKESTTNDIVQFGGTGASNFFAHNMSSGNFGIANANPSYKLDVTGTLRATGSSLLEGDVNIGSSYNGGGASPELYVRGNGGRTVKIHNPDAGTSCIQLTNATTGEGEDTGFFVQQLSSGDAMFTHIPADKDIIFRTSNAGTIGERLRISSDGLDVTGAISCGSSIGINGSGGTQYPLHVYSGQKYLVGLKNTSANSGIGYPWINHDSTAGGQSSLVVHFNGIGDRFFVRENGTAESTGAFTSTQLIATQGATTEFIQATSTNNGTRAVGSFAGKDSSGNAVTLKFGGYGDTGRGEIFTHSNHALGFATNNAPTQMVLDTDGRLIIGNTSDVAPDGFGSKIQVNAANHEGSIQIGRHTANSNGPILIFNKTRSGTSVPSAAALSRDDMLGGMRFFGSDGTDYNCNGGGIQAYMDGDASNNSFPGRLEFLTTTGGSPQGSVKMTISENGAIVTPLGSPLSYHATNATYEIYNDDHEIIIADSTSGWHVMKQWTATKSGQFFIKFQGKIEGGAYYWAADVYNLTQGKRINQSGTAPSSEALNGLNAFRFADFMDTNDTSAGNAVHEFRRHKLKCGNNSGSYVGEVKPGDIIQLRMASAAANGLLVTGVGQNLMCQNFRIYSDTPGRETGGKEFNPTNAAFHAIMGGGAQSFSQNDDLTWESTAFNRGYVTDSNNATVQYGFDVTNNCFRVPHTGVYHFYCNFFMNTATDCRISIEVDGTAYTSGYIWGCNTSEGSSTANQGGSQSLYLGRGSVVKLTVQSGSIGNTYGGHTSWGGFLIG